METAAPAVKRISNEQFLQIFMDRDNYPTVDRARAAVKEITGKEMPESTFIQRAQKLRKGSALLRNLPPYQRETTVRENENIDALVEKIGGEGIIEKLKKMGEEKEQKRLEREQKRLEREQKRLEREQKKAEAAAKKAASAEPDPNS